MAFKLEAGRQCYIDAAIVRNKVFVEEQGYKNEFDDIDDVCIHVVAYENNYPLGCARVFADDDDCTRFIIGRVAVLPEARKRGIGRLLVAKCEEAALDFNATEFVLHAQARLEPWYESMGYTRFGDVDYEDEGQPHLWMKKKIKKIEKVRNFA